VQGWRFRHYRPDWGSRGSQIDLAAMGKEKFLELVRLDVVRATWTGQDGEQKEKVLIRGGMPAIP